MKIKLFAAFVWVSYRIILNKQIVKKKQVPHELLPNILIISRGSILQQKKSATHYKKKNVLGRKTGWTWGDVSSSLPMYFLFQIARHHEICFTEPKIKKNCIKWQMIGSNNNMAFLRGIQRRTVSCCHG